MTVYKSSGKMGMKVNTPIRISGGYVPVRSAQR